MRTTIRLEDALLRRAKAQAAATGRSLNDFIADAVRAALAPRAQKGSRIELPTFKGHGLRAGVDLDDTATLLEIMEEAEPVVYQNPIVGRSRPRKVGERKDTK